jgi:hypothetical protein
MSTESNAAVLDQLFEPVSRCFTPDVARQIAELRAAPDVQARLDELADKCRDGTLSPQERNDYEYYVRAINFIGVLQAKARAVMASGSAR